MKNYWKIAIGVNSDKLEDFLDSLGEEEKTILSLAEEIREHEFAGKLWLFKEQMWGGNDPIIRKILKSLYALGDANYIYVTKLKPASSKTEIRGFFEALYFFRKVEYGMISGHFFEDINF